jgi:hypothetical protein
MKHTADSIRSQTDAFGRHSGVEKEIKREVSHDLGPERHSLLDRLPVEVHYGRRYVRRSRRSSAAPRHAWRTKEKPRGGGAS